MGECRHLREQVRLDVVAGDEQLDGLDRRRRRRVDEVLALDEEEPELVAPAALVQLADELELLVVAGADQVVVLVPLPRLWVASTKGCKDAGRVNSEELLARPRTRQRAA
jgi:hypothetical protein